MAEATTNAWRLPHPDDGRLIYRKGQYSYLMETMPFIELELAFDKIQKTHGAKRRSEVISIKRDPEIDTYDEEIGPDSAPENLAAITTSNGGNYAPLEAGPDHEHFLKALKRESTPDSFVPDFSKAPLRSYKKYVENYASQEMLVELYRHNYEGVDYDFYIASGNSKMVWIEKIERSDPEDKMLSTYGTRKNVSPFEPLCLKPKEYLKQCTALNGNRNWTNNKGHSIKSDRSKPVEIEIMNDTYGDIMPILNKYSKNSGLNRCLRRNEHRLLRGSNCLCSGEQSGRFCKQRRLE